MLFLYTHCRPPRFTRFPYTTLFRSVGDRVDVVGDTSGTPDTLARVVRVQPRRTALRRSADDTEAAERVIVANARSEEHTSELQSRGHLVCRPLPAKTNKETLKPLRT